MPRWTERERTALIADLRDQIELVWMTGELHLEKPTVQHEVSRGLHFFDEALFEKAPELLALVDGALEQYYPGKSFELPPFFQFGSWIGGDRDGNPSVTTSVTGWTLAAERASPRFAITVTASSASPGRFPSPSGRSLFRRASAPSSCARLREAARPTPSGRAIPASPTGNISASCCASSTPPSPASRAWISAALARLTPVPTS